MSRTYLLVFLVCVIVAGLACLGYAIGCAVVGDNGWGIYFCVLALINAHTGHRLRKLIWEPA